MILLFFSFIFFYWKDLGLSKIDQSILREILYDCIALMLKCLLELYILYQHFFLAICSQFTPSPCNINDKIYDEIAKKLQIKKKNLDEITKLWMKIELWICDMGDCKKHKSYSLSQLE